MEVGQKVWVVAKGRRMSDTPNITEEQIASIGRKYFTLAGRMYDRDKFHIDTLRISSDFLNDTRVYLDLQEYYDEVEALKLGQELRSYIGQWGSTGLSLDQLKKILAIIGDGTKG